MAAVATEKAASPPVKCKKACPITLKGDGCVFAPVIALSWLGSSAARHRQALQSPEAVDHPGMKESCPRLSLMMYGEVGIYKGLRQIGGLLFERRAKVVAANSYYA